MAEQEQKQGEQPATGQAPAQQQTPPQADWKPPSREEHEAQQREIAALRKESADRRIAARQAEEAKLAADKAKAEAEGRWQDVVKLEREKNEALAKEAESLRSIKARADALEADRKAEAESLRKSIGDRAAVVPDSIPPEMQVQWLRSISGPAAPGKPAAPPPAVGNPPAAPNPRPDMGSMSPADRKRYLATLPHDELRRIAREMDGEQRSGVFTGFAKR